MENTKIILYGNQRRVVLGLNQITNKSNANRIIVALNEDSFIYKVDYLRNFNEEELTSKELYILETSKGFNMLEHIHLNLPKYSGFFIDRYQLLKRGIKCELLDEDKDKFFEFTQKNKLSDKILNLIERRVFLFNC